MRFFMGTSRVLVTSFALVILLGALALVVSSRLTPRGIDVSFVDALFTATSAVCVTGLIVLDTGRDFSPVGQVIILVLIQAGGLGILTFTNLLVLIHRGRFSIHERVLIQETHGLLPHVKPARLLWLVILYTVLCESIGAIILSARFAVDYPLDQAVWLGVFHAVSAFCNAGFSLFSTSLVQYRGDWVINLTVMALIILGGLGFIVVADVLAWMGGQRRRPTRRLSYHAQLVLWTSGVLLAGGTVFIFLLDMAGAALSVGWANKVLECLFLSVTARTAGFNTVPTQELTNGALLIVIMLMAIGGSPGSTAGGMKTTTAAVLFALVRSRIRNRPKVELFYRSVPTDIVAKALIAATGFLAVVIAGSLALQVTEAYGMPHTQMRGLFLDHLFEVVSALGTVGLSTGVTETLSSAGKFVIIALMFAGRLGPVIVGTSLLGSQRRLAYSYPEETVIIG